MLAEETNLIIWISARFPRLRIAGPIVPTFIHREKFANCREQRGERVISLGIKERKRERKRKRKNEFIEYEKKEIVQMGRK
jgi:hypothetical protein